VYVHKAGVTTQIIPCKRMYIGKTNSTEKISTSSYSKNRCDPLAGAGRLEIPSNVGLRRRNTNYWCPSKANMYEYLQVSLKEGPTKIGGFLMQGTVTEFEVRYSLNDVESQYFVYREKDGIKKFNNTVDHIFDTSASKPGFPVYKHFMYTPGSAYIQTNKQGMSHPFAQHVRFYPKKWKEGAEILMKVDLLECIACGDGFTDRTEECDDGNMVDGDGCSGADAVRLGYPKPCTMETHLGQFWCEDMTDGPRRGNAIGDCLYRTDHATGTTVGGERYPKAPQKRYYAARHYIDRGGISTGGYNSGILPLCDGVVCDGQNPYG
jgi:cysteine-rich repeat protein